MDLTNKKLDLAYFLREKIYIYFSKYEISMFIKKYWLILEMSYNLFYSLIPSLLISSLVYLFNVIKIHMLFITMGTKNE